MERSNSEKLKLGVFVILGTVLLVVAVYLIGNKQNLFGNTFEIHTIFKNVNGLQSGNNVRFSGVAVGTVRSIEMMNDTSIRVNMIIDDKMLEHIRQNSVATVGSDGLVGSMLINIVPGKGTAPLIEPGDMLRSYSKIATEDMMTTLSVTNENAALLTVDLLTISQSIISGKGTLGMLLNDTVMAADLRRTLTELRATSSDASSAMREIRRMVEEMQFEESVAGVLLNDTVSGRRMKDIIEDLENTSKQLEKMSQDLSEVIGEMKDGEGAIHYLSSDTVFVQQLESTMINIEEGTARFNEDMEALKHSFLFKKYFKKLEKEKRKEERKAADQQ